MSKINLWFNKIRRPLDFRRGCHQAAGMGNQLYLGMFSAISLGFRFPLFISIHLSCSFCLDVCFQMSANWLLVPQNRTNHHLPLPDMGFGFALKITKNQRKTCTWNVHQKSSLELRLDPQFLKKIVKSRLKTHPRKDVGKSCARRPNLAPQNSEK